MSDSRQSWSCMFLGILVASLPVANIAVPPSVATSEEDQVVIGFIGTVPSTTDDRLEAQGATLARQDDDLHFVVATTPNPDGLIAWTGNEPDVEFAHLDHRAKPSGDTTEIITTPCTTFDSPADDSELLVCGDTVSSQEGGSDEDSSPNDPFFWHRCGPISRQWGLRTVGIRDAWNTSMGSASTLLAVLDSGVDSDHPDLAENVHKVAGQVIGVDLANHDSVPEDNYGHGTVVAGVSAARIDNELMMAGTAQVAILPVKVYESLGPTASDFASGVAWAVAAGADVLVFASSFEPGSDSGLTANLWFRATEFAEASGVPIVASSGNWADLFGANSVGIPASYETVIGVGGVSRTLTRGSYSGYGPGLDVVAPGGLGGSDGCEDILSLYPTQLSGDGVSVSFGTSLSAPLVAGTVALILSADPSITPGEVRTVLRETAQDLGPVGWDAEYGYGLIDPATALATLD